MSFIYILLVIVAALFVLLLIELQDYNVEDILDTQENRNEGKDSNRTELTDHSDR